MENTLEDIYVRKDVYNVETYRIDQRFDAADRLLIERLDNLRETIEKNQVEIRGELKNINTRIDSLEKSLNARIDATNARIDSLESSLNKRIDDTNTRIDDLKDRQEHILTRWGIVAALGVGLVQVAVAVTLYLLGR